MRLLLLFFIVFGMCGGLLGQPGIQWQRTLGGTETDGAREAHQTTDGGYIIAGNTFSNDGDIENNYGLFDVWVTKLDSLGNLQWARNYGGSDTDVAYSIRQTLDGGFIIAGETSSNDIDVSGNHGDRDAWVLKLDSLGGIQWQKCLGGTNWEDAWDIRLTSDGGFIFVGRSNSNDGDVTGNLGSLDYWVVKLSSAGEIQWQKCLGGSNLDTGFAICPTSDGGYIVGGGSQSTDGNITGNHDSPDAWVAKLNFEGKIEWQRSLGGFGFDRANDIHETRDGGYIVFGQTDSNDGDVSGNHSNANDLWAVKLNTLGEIEWQKPLGGIKDDYGSSIKQTNDGGFVALGYVNSTNGDVTGNHGSTDVWVVKLSETGDLLWQKTFGGTSQDRGFSIAETADLGLLVAGDSWSNNGDVTENQGFGDFWIIKLNPETSTTSQATTLPLNLYPNPAQNTLQIQIPTPASSANLTLSNALGQILLNQNLSLDSFGKAQLDLSAVPNGFYLLSATLPDGQVFSGKMHKLE